MTTLPDLPSGVYRHYKGPLYFVFGYGHDANADSLFEQVGERDFRRLDTTEEGGDRQRAVVVYMGLELTDAHTGPRWAVRTAADFFARMHLGQPERFTEGTVCEGDCWNRALNIDGLNNHLVVQRFTYVGPTWEGS